jgi:predicted Zn-ribbon and HTH transcriptional regulator
MKKLACKRCGHQWYKRSPKNPKVCPRCKRKDWQTKA